MKVKKVFATGICVALVLSCNYVLLIYFYKEWIPSLSSFANSTFLPMNISRNISTTELPSANAQNTSLSPTRTTLPSPITRTTASFKVVESCKRTSLKGPLRIDFKEALERYEIESRLNTNGNETDGIFLGNYTVKHPADCSSVLVGGDNCIPEQIVAIIIPFRDRESHLKILLGHLLPILQRQGSRFSIFVVEQVGDGVFNKGRVMNTGFKYAKAASTITETPFQCYLFHDVDLMMENDKLLYKCTGGNYVDHLSTTINKFDYKPLCCGMTVGGVLAFSGDQFHQVNGFPNNFWGWGGEDDAMNERIRLKGLRIKRPNFSTGRYTMIKHERDGLNSANGQIDDAMKSSRDRLDSNGLADLQTTIVGVHQYQFFTRVFVDVGMNGTSQQ